jgi:hypothetical protein
MKKIIILFLVAALLIIVYRSFFCYRIIAFSNTGDKKYKMNEIIYFPQPPMSIINPFKKQSLLNKIKDYCASTEFEKYIKEKHIKSDRNYRIYKEFSLNGLLEIESIKDAENQIHVLVANKNDYDYEIVFIFDSTKKQVVGFY